MRAFDEILCAQFADVFAHVVGMNIEKACDIGIGGWIFHDQGSVLPKTEAQGHVENKFPYLIARGCVHADIARNIVDVAAVVRLFQLMRDKLGLGLQKGKVILLGGHVYGDRGIGHHVFPHMWGTCPCGIEHGVLRHKSGEGFIAGRIGQIYFEIALMDVEDAVLALVFTVAGTRVNRSAFQILAVKIIFQKESFNLRMIKDVIIKEMISRIVNVVHGCTSFSQSVHQAVFIII